MGRNSTLGNTKALLPYAPPDDQKWPHQTAKFHCPYCTLSWVKECDLKRHVTSHNNVKPYACEHEGCTKSFAQKTALMTHWNTHTGARPHACRHPGCTSAFGDPSSRTRHEKETHDPSNGYKCTKCNTISKRREQFRRHFKECLNKDASEDDFAASRKYCKDSYKQAAKEEAKEEAAIRPPKRKRRGAVVTLSPSTPPEDYEDEEELGRRESPPRYEPSYKGDMSSESPMTPSPNFYREASHFDEPVDSQSYVDAFEPAYTPLPASHYYSQPPPEYTPRQSSSPEHHFGHSIQLPRINSPHYDIHSMNDRVSGSFHNRDRMSTSDSFSTIQSSPGHIGHYSISTSHVMGSPHLAHSPHVSASTPPLLVPISSRSAILFDHSNDSPPLLYPQSSYGVIDPADRIPRGALNPGHHQLQNRQYLQQYRHHPYAHERRGGISDIYGNEHGSPSGSGLPIVDNSYNGQSDAGSDRMHPLSLATVRGTKPMMGSPYESSAPF